MKFVFTCLLSALFLCSSFAQEKTYWGTKPFRGGIMAGGNASQVDGDTDGGYHKFGINVGGMVYGNFTPRLGMSVELLFSQKGSRFAREKMSAGGSYFMVYFMKLNYVEVPLLLHYYVTEKIHIGAGLSYGRLINSDEQYRSLYGWVKLDGQKFPYQKDVWEYVVSAGYRLTENLLLDFRYQYSIAPLRKARNVPNDFSGFVDQKNNMLSLRLGYFF